MLEIWLILTIATIGVIYLGNKFYNLGYYKAGSIMILVGCLQLIAEGVALF